MLLTVLKALNEGSYDAYFQLRGSFTEQPPPGADIDFQYFSPYYVGNRPFENNNKMRDQHYIRLQDFLLSGASPLWAWKGPKAIPPFYSSQRLITEPASEFNSQRFDSESIKSVLREFTESKSYAKSYYKAWRE